MTLAMYTHTYTYTLTNVCTSVHNPLYTIHTSAVHHPVYTIHTSVVHCPLYTIHIPAIRHTVHCMLSVIHTIHCMLLTHPSYTVYCMSCVSVVHHTLYVVYVLIGRHSSVQTSHLSCTHHISHTDVMSVMYPHLKTHIFKSVQ